MQAPVTNTMRDLEAFKINTKAYGTGRTVESVVLDLNKLPWFKEALLLCEGESEGLGVKFKKFRQGGFYYDWESPKEFFTWLEEKHKEMEPYEWKAFLKTHLDIEVPPTTSQGETIVNAFDIDHWMNFDGNDMGDKYYYGVMDLFAKMLRCRDLHAVSEEQKQTHRLKYLGAYDVETDF